MKRLYHAFCQLIEAKADHLTARAEYTRQPDESPEPQKGGSTSQNQVTGKYEPNDMRAGFNRTGIGFTGAGQRHTTHARTHEMSTQIDR